MSDPGGREESPVGGAGGRGVLLLAVAVVLGIVVLQATDSGSPSTDVSTTPATAPAARVTTTGLPTVSTARAVRPPAEVKALPANGTQVSGLGGRVGDVLKALGYTNTLSAVDATANTLETSIVQFSPGFDAEALVLAQTLGLSPAVVQPLNNPPVRDTRGADVIVIAGADLERLMVVVTTTTG